MRMITGRTELLGRKPRRRARWELRRPNTSPDATRPGSQQIGPYPADATQKGNGQPARHLRGLPQTWYADFYL